MNKKQIIKNIKISTADELTIYHYETEEQRIYNTWIENRENLIASSLGTKYLKVQNKIRELTPAMIESLEDKEQVSNLKVKETINAKNYENSKKVSK